MYPGLEPTTPQVESTLSQAKVLEEKIEIRR